MKADSGLRALLVWVVTRGIVLGMAINSPPELIASYYSPFIEHVLVEPSMDPWTSWADSGGDQQAFPYGWPMVGILLVLSSPALITQDMVTGISLGLMLVDLLALFAIHRLEAHWSGGPGKSSLYYASMPVVPAAIMLAGSNDIIPMLLLFISVWLVLRKKYGQGGALLGLAVGTKPLLVIVLFAMILFTSRTAWHRESVMRLIICSLAALLASFAPLAYSEGFREALLSSNDVSRVLYWGVATSEGMLPLLPGVLLVCLIAIWKLRRMNGDLLLVSTSLPIILLAGLPNAPIGWAIWAIPLVLVASGALSNRLKLFGWITLNFGLVVFLSLDRAIGAEGVLSTIHISLVGSFAYLLWIELVKQNDLTKLLSRPALILIAGDSGVGKDTLSDGLSRLLGEKTTLHLSGDNYHRWDRGSRNWEYMTHLDPKANDLDQYFSDLLDIVSGREVSVSHYDHSSGRSLPPKSSAGKEFVISSGLHALSSEDLNSQANLKVFLGMSEDLRVSLKVARDVEKRGHSERDILEVIEKRRPDYYEFVKPQAACADLEFWSYADPSAFSSVSIDFTSKAKPFDSKLVNELAYGCGLRLTTTHLEDGRRTISVSGELDSALLTKSFASIEPRIARALGSLDGWSQGAPGLIQFITLVYLSNLLKQDRLVG